MLSPLRNTQTQHTVRYNVGWYFVFETIEKGHTILFKFISKLSHTCDPKLSYNNKFQILWQLNLNYFCHITFSQNVLTLWHFMKDSYLFWCHKPRRDISFICENAIAENFISDLSDGHTSRKIKRRVNLLVSSDESPEWEPRFVNCHDSFEFEIKTRYPELRKLKYLTLYTLGKETLCTAVLCNNFRYISVIYSRQMLWNPAVHSETLSYSGKVTCWYCLLAFIKWANFGFIQTCFVKLLFFFVC